MPSMRIALHHFRPGVNSTSQSQMTLCASSSSPLLCELSPYPPYNSTERKRDDNPTNNPIGGTTYEFYHVPNVPKSMYTVDASNSRHLPPVSLPVAGVHVPSPSAVVAAQADTYRNVPLDIRLRTTGIQAIERNFEPTAAFQERAEMVENMTALLKELNFAKLTIVDLTEQVSTLNLTAEKDLAAARRYQEGLCRLNLTSADYHAYHRNDAAYYYGKRSFDDVRQYFQDLHHPLEATTMHDDPKFTKIPNHDIAFTQFEKYLVALQYFHRSFPITHLAKIWGRTGKTIGKYLKEWAPRIGQAGLCMSMLDCNAAWIKYELPEEYVEVSMEKVAAVVDGKDVGTATLRSSTLLHRLQWSDKVSGSAGRGLTFSSKIGVILEHTGLWMGRVSETALMKLWGASCGEVPLQQWAQGSATTVEEEGRPTPPPPPRQTLKVFSKYLSKSKKKTELEEREAAVDGQEGGVGCVDVKPSLPLLTNIKTWFFQRIADLELSDAGGAVDPLSTAGITAAQVEHVHKHNPYRSRATTLAHFETHERLHRSYTDGRLLPCILSYYLDFFASDRLLILRHLGSSLTRDEVSEGVSEGDPMTMEEGGIHPLPPLPKLWPRLAKFPVGFSLSGDKGFHRDAASLPNQNLIHTPVRLDGRKQNTRGESEHGRRVKKNRYTSEVVYSRVTDVSILCDIVPRERMRYLGHAWNWAHGRANLQQPLLKPLNWKAYLDKVRLTTAAATSDE